MGKRQHYVPQFYLRFFSDDDKTVAIFLFQKRLYRSRVPIKSILYKPDLYDNDDSKERAISQLESKWNASLKRIVADFSGDFTNDEKSKIAESDLFNLYSFICFTHMRTHQQISALTFQSETFIHDMQDRFPEISSAEIDEFNPLLDPYFEADTALRSGVSMLPYFIDLVPVFLQNRTSQSFITSDAPIVPFNPFFEHINYLGNSGLGNCGLQVYCPLSSKLAVLLYDPDIYKFKNTDHPIIQPIESPKDVRTLNGLIVSHSYETIVMPPEYPECNIKGLCKYKKHPFSGVSLDVCKTTDSSNPILYCSHFVQIKSKYLAPCMQIAPSSPVVRFPRNTAGPLRDSVKALNNVRSKRQSISNNDGEPFSSERIGTYTPEGFITANPYNGPKGYFINPGKIID